MDFPCLHPFQIAYRCPCWFLYLEINPLHPVADGGEYFVWDGAKCVGKNGDRQVVAENFDGVSLLTVDISDIDHGHVHADVSHVRSFFPIYEAVASPSTQTSVESVCISDGDSGDDAVPCQNAFSTVSHSLILWYVTHLQDGGFQCADIIEDFVVPAVDAV